MLHRRRLAIGYLLCGLVYPMLSGCRQQEDDSSGTTDPHSIASVVPLGAILPLTGDLAKYGKTSKAAIELAVEEINAKVRADGFRLSCVFEDDALKASTGVAAAKKLIDRDHVVAIIGPLASSITLAVAPVVERRHVVLLSPGASTPELTDAGEYVFRNCLSDIYEGRKMAEVARELLKLERVAILHIQNDFGVGLQRVFKEEFERRGGVVAGVEIFAQGSRDHRAPLARIAQYQASGVYLIGYDEMISVFRQARELGMVQQWLATTFLNDQELLSKMGDTADGAVLVAWDYNPEADDPRLRAFTEQIKKRTDGLSPDVFAANAYDAVYLIAESIRREGTTSSDIKNGLYSIHDYVGVTGKISFDDRGDVSKPLRIKTVVGGKISPFDVDGSTGG